MLPRWIPPRYHSPLPVANRDRHRSNSPQHRTIGVETRGRHRREQGWGGGTAPATPHFRHPSPSPHFRHPFRSLHLLPPLLPPSPFPFPLSFYPLSLSPFLLLTPPFPFCPLSLPLCITCGYPGIPGDTTTTTQSMSAVRSQHHVRQVLHTCTSNLTLHWQCVCRTSNAPHSTRKVLTELAMSHRGHSRVRHPLDIQAPFPPVGGTAPVCDWCVTGV